MTTVQANISMREQAKAQAGVRIGALSSVRAQQGASMPLALLLFLVCATLASVVLAAATAVGGEATTLKKSEQSYFAVTSAAKLLREQLNGQTIVIKTTTTDPANSTTDGTTIRDGLKLGGTATLTLLEKITVSKYAPSQYATSAQPMDPFTLTSSKNNNALDANVDISDGDNDTKVLTVSQKAADDDDSKDDYKLKLILTPDVDTYTETTEAANGDKVTTTETRVTWWIDEIQVAGGASS